MTMRDGLVLAWVILASVVSSAAVAEDSEVLAASSGRHVFVVHADHEDQGWSIAHLDTEEGPGVIRTVHRLKTRPEAIAAWGNRCWVVLPPRDAQRISRVVISLAVQRHPINGVWYADPPRAPKVLPPVPKDGRVAGLVATPSELLLVFVPSQRQLRGVDRPDRPEGQDAAADSTVAEEPRDAMSDLFPDFDSERGGFLRLSLPGAMSWEQVVGPDVWDTATGVCAGLVARPDGLRPAVVWSQVGREGWYLSVFESDGGCPKAIGFGEHGDGRDDSTPSSLGNQTADGSDASLIGAASERGGSSLGLTGVPVSLEAMAGRTSLATRQPDGELAIGSLLIKDGMHGSVEIRPFSVLPKGNPAPNVGMVLTPAGPWMVGVTGAEVITTTLDRSTGKANDAQVAEEATAEGTLVPYEIALFVVVTSFLAVLFLRPVLTGAPSVVVPGLKGLGFARRAAGLCIDLAPGAMAVIVIFQLDPLTYVEDLRAGEVDAIPPLLAMMGISGALAAILEVSTGRSLGKWLVGGKILRLDGSPATALQRGLRSLLRLSILLLIPLAWPLALLPLLDPVGRGIPELLTRTVVSPGPPPAPPSVPPSDTD
ncbi:MAG: hypothetical protein CMJ67_00215 [Planctomycetaceae bacterium]|nr:hypothetical protein [Planctomycetaceae bacterium]